MLSQALLQQLAYWMGIHITVFYQEYEKRSRTYLSYCLGGTEVKERVVCRVCQCTIKIGHA
jgi:hypothetical protein